MTRDWQLYGEAIEQLETACNELDQAHATLRDLQMEHTSIRHGQRDITIAGIFRLAATLLDAVKHAECGQCWEEISKHPREGCPQWQK